MPIKFALQFLSLFCLLKAHIEILDFIYKFIDSKEGQFKYVLYILIREIKWVKEGERRDGDILGKKIES